MAIHESAIVHETAVIGQNTSIWGGAQIREGARIGANCTIGRNAYVGPGVVIGDNCKIQNNALIYEPSVLEDGVFVGPAVVLTNDKNPRAVNLDGSLKGPSDWEMVGVTVRKGAAIGANSTCIAPVEIGEWALVGAGSVVTKDVIPGTTVAGNPAKPLTKRGF